MQTISSQAFDACLAEALAHMREWVPRWLSRLHEALQQREVTVNNVHEKLMYVQARQQLESLRDVVAIRFIEAFAVTLQDGQHALYTPTRTLSSVSFDELELMGDEQVQEAVDFARVQQVIKLAADEALVALNGRISRAQGLDMTRPEANPLRTEVMVSVLLQTLTALQVDSAVRTRWLQTGAVALGQELSLAYNRLSRLLDGFGIVPAGFHVIQTPQGRGLPGAVVGAATLARPDDGVHASVLNSDALLTLGHLHQLLAGKLQNTPEAVEPSASATPSMAANMVRALAAEVVTLMMRSIDEDNRLLPALRQQLGDMKPALLALARNDPRFFANRDNPARQLLETVTERSLAFTREDDPSYKAFTQEVQGIVKALHAPSADVSARFPDLLDKLKQSPSQTMAPEQAQARGLAVQTLVRVERRNLLAERVVGEIEARNDFARAPEFVRDFLVGPWAQVVAQARMEATAQPSTPGQLSPAETLALRYIEVLPDLLWSSQLALVSRNRARLLKVIPGVLSTLREGLQTIAYPEESSEAFFQALMALHMTASKVPRTEKSSGLEHSRQFEAPAETLSPHSRQFEALPEPASPPSRSFEVPMEPWIQPMEARDSCLLDDTRLDDKPAFASVTPVQRDWADIKAEMANQHTQVLPVGTWVDMWQDGQSLRCQITWASPHGTMFILTGPDKRSISVTRRSMERLREQDRLRVVAAHGVVDSALDAVARQAWINSAKQ
jgi:hypothetical protein